MSIFLIVVKKMPIAALHGKTIKHFVKTVDNLNYWYIDHNIGEPSLLKIQIEP